MDKLKELIELFEEAPDPDQLGIAGERAFAHHYMDCYERVKRAIVRYGWTCEVCGMETDHCVPSPMGPFSRPMCSPCMQANRLPYRELVLAMSNRAGGGESMFDKEFGTEYIDKYIAPTLEVHAVTYGQLMADAKMYWDKQKLPKWCLPQHAQEEGTDAIQIQRDIEVQEGG